MKRLKVLMAVFIIVAIIPPADIDGPLPFATFEPQTSPQLRNSRQILASAEGVGDDASGTQFFSRVVTNLKLDIMNSYDSPSLHHADLDLNPLLVEGWSMYQVSIDVENLTAAPEREVLGTSDDETGFTTEKSGSFYYDTLVQGFYNQSHDGLLYNFSSYYFTRDYDPALNNPAYLVIRTDKTNSSSNVTLPESMTDVGLVRTWLTVQSVVNLSSNTVYYATIDGESLIEFGGFYPEIYWLAENIVGSFTTERHYTFMDQWSTWPDEALLNYTYTPWNQTANSPLEFSTFEAANVTVNGTAGSGLTWTSDAVDGNVTQLQFDANQSVYMFYNLTLWYSRSTTVSTLWNAQTAGSIIDWNTTMTLSYPSGLGTIDKYANVSIPYDWTLGTLYNSTTPSTPYDNCTQFTTVVRCQYMTNGTWTLTLTAPNHVDEIQAPGSSSILANADIVVVSKDGGGTNVTSGSTNLTVRQSGSTVWSPANVSVSNGAASYLWDIDATTSSNGTFTIGAFWSNGTEAGFLEITVVVYYTTSLTPAEMNISAFTELDPSFVLSIDFVDTFNSQGLTDSSASVVHNFTGSPSPMTHVGGGTWNASVSTMDVTPGSYMVQVNATGFAIENQTTYIKVTLVHETDPMIVAWSNTDTISFVESTDLSVTYRNTTGAKNPIPGAWVNITIGGTSWNLTYSGGVYTITFNGTDLPPGFGVHALEIEAWRSGYQNQSESTETLTIQLESTGLDLTWSNTNNITYVEQTTLSANYTMSNGTAILGSWVNITIGGDTWNLTWNGASETYQLTFNGSDAPPDLGEHSIDVRAWIYGYIDQLNNSEQLIMTIEPTSILVQWEQTQGNNITFVESTKLVVNYRRNDSSEISDGTVIANIGFDAWPVAWNGSAYVIQYNGTDSPPGFGTWTVIIDAARVGHQSQNPSTNLTIRREPTTVTATWYSYTMDWTQSVVLGLDYRDTYSSLINESTTLDISVNGTLYTLHGDNGTYWIEFNNTLGLGYHTVTVDLGKYGYLNAYDDTIHFNITIALTTLNLVWTTVVIDYLGQIDLTANYTYDGTGLAVPVGDVTANISIDGALPQDLNVSGSLWTANLTGIFLDLGTHNVEIRAWAYGYEFQLMIQGLNVNNVTTNPLVVSWTPSNATIQYSESLNLTVDYTFGGGDVPEPALVNVTIRGLPYAFTYNTTDFLWHGSVPGSGIGVGVFTATISAWSYGYQVQTNVTFGVNITLAANSFVVEWTPFDRNVTYIEYLNLSVIYTKDFAPILGSWVRVTLNGSRTYNLTYSGIDEKWHVLLSADVVDLGIWNATVVANRTGYATGTSWSLLTVNEDIPILVPSWISNSTDYVTPLLLQVAVTASNGTPLTIAAILSDTDGQAAAGTHIGSGDYDITLGPFVSLGNNTVNVTMVQWGYRTSSIFLTLTVNATETQIDPTIDKTTVYYDENVITDFAFEMLNGSYVPTATILFTIEGIPQSMTWASDHWHLVIQGDSLGLGTHHCIVNTTRYGYISQQYEFDITVNPIPTSISTLGDEWLYVNDTVTIQIEFDDSRGMGTTEIDADAVTITWAIVSGYTWVRESEGVYSLTLSSTVLHVGSYQLSVLLDKVGHVSSSTNLDIDVRPVPVELIHLSLISQYQNETVDISVTLNDTYHSAIVSWAVVDLALDGTNYTMVYDTITQSYQTSVWLNHEVFTDNIYPITLYANATDTVQVLSTMQLRVDPKTTYTLTVVVPESVIEGTGLAVTVHMTEQGEPVFGQTVIVFASFSNGNGDTLESKTPVTNEAGEAQANFDVPTGSTEVEVWAAFMGTESEWSATSTTGQVRVMAGFEAILVLMTRPEILIGLMALVGAVSARVFYTRRIKPKKRAKFASLENQHDVFKNLESMQHFMAVYSDRGTCVLYHPFGESRIQPDLVSGFISAITSVYGEITGDGVQGTLEEIHYQGLRLNSYSGQYVIGILILEEELMPELREGLQTFVQDFEKKYNEDLDGWVGVVDTFDETWILKALYESMNYIWHLPYKCDPKKKAKGAFERTAVLLKSRSDDNGEFKISEVLPSVAEIAGRTEAEALEHLLKMIERGLIVPLDIPTFLHREGCSLFGGTEFSPMDEPVGEVAEVSTVEESVEEPLVEELEDEAPEETPEPIEDVEEPEEPVESAKPEIDEEESTDDEPREVADKVEEPIEPPEEAPEGQQADPMEEFVTDLEELLKEDKKPPEEEPADPLEDFVTDLEELLKEDKENNDKKK